MTDRLLGIRGPIVFRPETTEPLSALLEVLRTRPHSITPADPEIYREIGQETAWLGYVNRDYKTPLQAIAAKQRASSG